jgi:hypothetical protein
MLGAQYQPVTSDYLFVKTIDQFSHALDEVADSCTNNPAKAAFIIWSGAFKTLSTGIRRCARPGGLLVSNAGTITKYLIESIHVSTDTIGRAFKELDRDVAGFFIYMSTQLETTSLIWDSLISNDKDFNDRLMRFAGLIGRLIRQLHCVNTSYYNFLGEDAETKMSQIFDILDPDHDATLRGTGNSPHPEEGT